MKLFFALVFLFSSLFSAAQSVSNHQGSDAAGTNYKPGAIIFKWLPEYRDAWIESAHQAKTWRLNDPELERFCATQGAFTVRPLFPHHMGRKAGRVDLSLIGEFLFPENIDVPALCRQLAASGRFQYVEPRFIFKTSGSAGNWPVANNNSTLPAFLPNDSLFNLQWHLAKIHAAEAWDIEQGDSSIVIGIVDSGVDYLHPDLAANIAVNYADPVNGLDDDGNGFVDDYYGWDFYHNDNDPKPFTNHGTAVAGVAAASTNNGTGLAAPGFNCRVLPIKGSSDNPADLNITYGGEGIVYAADRGCRIINCSWGGPGTPSTALLYKDLVEYVTFDKNALLIGVAHNYNNNTLNYPASADYVMSIAATDQNDVRESYSNFNHLVDLAAPSTIWVPMMGGTYVDGWNGTSFAAPQVAGAAGLLAAHHPTWTGLQIAERLRITSDEIHVQNPNYGEQLGKGRLNMFRALNDPPSPAVRFESVIAIDGNDNLLQIGDTIRLSGAFVNYLADVGNLEVTMSSVNQNVQWINNTVNLNGLTTLASATNHAEPFVFVLGAGVPFDTYFPIRLNYHADGYDDWQWIFISLNKTRVDFDNGRLASTLTSIGRIGHINYFGDGIGVRSSTNPTAGDAAVGLMIGNTAGLVSDAALTSWSSSGSTFANDFKIIEPIHAVWPPLADFHYTCAYNDSAVTPPIWRMGLHVRQQVYTWDFDPFVISEYEITNNSNNTYNALRVGLWAETDILPYTENRAEQEDELRLLYTYATNLKDSYIGIQALGQTPFNSYAYDYSPSYGGVNVNDSYSSSEKFTTLSQSRPTGGFEDADGSDLGLVVGEGPFQLAPGGKLKTAFAILVADSLPALLAAAEVAKVRYAALLSVGTHSPMVYENLLVTPNPASETFAVQLDPGEDWDLMIYDSKGQLQYQSRASGPHLVSLAGRPSGLYLIRAVAGERVRVGKVVKQ